MVTLPGIWHDTVSARTGWPGISILWLGEADSLICNFYLSVATHTTVWADPFWDTLACYWNVYQPTNNNKPRMEIASSVVQVHSLSCIPEPWNLPPAQLKFTHFILLTTLYLSSLLREGERESVCVCVWGGGGGGVCVCVWERDGVWGKGGWAGLVWVDAGELMCM